jgi:hypothetical protein
VVVQIRDGVQPHNKTQHQILNNTEQHTQNQLPTADAARQHICNMISSALTCTRASFLRPPALRGGANLRRCLATLLFNAYELFVNVKNYPDALKIRAAMTQTTPLEHARTHTQISLQQHAVTHRTLTCSKAYFLSPPPALHGGADT